MPTEAERAAFKTAELHRGHFCNECVAAAVADYAARLREAVKELVIRNDILEPPDGIHDHIDGDCGFRAAVLRLIEEKK